MEARLKKGTGIGDRTKACDAAATAMAEAMMMVKMTPDILRETTEDTAAAIIRGGFIEVARAIEDMIRAVGLPDAEVCLMASRAVEGFMATEDAAMRTLGRMASTAEAWDESLRAAAEAQGVE